MSLHTVWFIIEVAFWTGFFVLEGFDLGVGMLHSFVGRDDVERRTAINSIGPFWDGNEVWLIVAGAVMFAAFPAWYGTMFSSLYLALGLLLLALILRGVSFELRGKVDDPRWHLAFRWTMTVGSFLIPFLVGVGLGDLLVGLPINAQHDYTGSFWNLLTPYGVYVGVTMVVLCLLNGATFLVLKTQGPVRRRAYRAARVSVLAVLLLIGFIIWTSQLSSRGVVPSPFEIAAVLAIAAAAWLTSTQYEGWAFAVTVVGVGFTVVSLFQALYPNVMVSSTSAAYNLTVANASSNSYALKVMTVVAAVFMPLVLAYQGWSFWVFRRRMGPPPAAPGTPDQRETASDVASSRRASEPALSAIEASGDGSADDSGDGSA
jgi:cytochrome bd-type quinol oxidase subunit 2